MAQASETSLIWEPTPRQTVAMQSNADETFFGGARGGGKSEALVIEPLRQIHIPHYRALILRRTYDELTELIDKSVKYYSNVTSPRPKFNRTEHVWTFPSGAKIKFANMKESEDWRKYQGHQYDFIGYDELTNFEQQQYIGLFGSNRASGAGTKVYMWATGNPGGVGMAWVKERFIRPLQPDIPREFIEELNGTILKRSRCFVPSYVDDNPYLLANNPQYIATLNALPDKDRRQQLYGDWDVADDSYFDGASIARRKPELQTVIAERDGSYRYYKRPQPGNTYAIGADPAGSGIDYYVIQVIDAITYEQCAVWYQQSGDFEFLDALERLSREYGATVAVETNFNPLFTQLLADRNVPQYVHSETSKVHADKRLQAIYGIQTTHANREPMLSALRGILQYNPLGYGIISCEATLDELETFIIDPATGKAEAAPGAHDDQVMSYALSAHLARSGQCIALRETELQVGWTEAMILSFRHANYKKRRELLQEWRSKGLIKD